jgi:putative ABC transport system permease protein
MSRLHLPMDADPTRLSRLQAIWESFVQDATYTIRMVRRSPGFAAVAVLTLALGIGANTAIFSVVNAVLLRPLPYPESEGIVRIFENVMPPGGAGGAPRRMAALTVSELESFRSHSKTVSGLGVSIPTIRTLTGGSEAARLVGTRLTPSIFAMLGAHPTLGRPVRAEEGAAGADTVIILSHSTWQRYFGGSDTVIGQTAMFDGTPHTIVGVMPAGFAFPDPETEFWMPFVAAASDTRRLGVTARLQRGVTLAAAADEMATIIPQLRNEPAGGAPPLPSGVPRFEVARLLDLTVAPVKPVLLLLAGAVGFVLVIACLNVANLLLARSADRQREMAVRLAVGASRSRLIRQTLTESLLLAVIGGLAGVGLAFGGVRLLRTLGASLPRRDLGPVPSLPRLAEIEIDGSVLLFTVLVSILTCVLFGIAPAMRLSGSQRMTALRSGTVATGAGFNLFRGERVQGLLVIVEIAMAMVLLIGGGLLIHSFVKLSRVDLGYDPSHVLSFQVSLPAGRTDLQLRQLADRLVERLESLPQVRTVGYVEALPNTMVSGRVVPLRTTPQMPASIGRPMPGAFPPETPDTRFVSKDFLSSLGIEAVAGRTFGENDGPGQPRVLLINETLARSGLLGATPLGRHVYALGDQPWEVIGIVEDVRQFGPAQRADPQLFIDFRQVPESQRISGVGLYFSVRVDGEPSALVPNVRMVSRELDAQTVVDNIAPLEQLVSNAVARPRLYAVLLGIFAAVAVLVAAFGIYGVMSHAVARRTREIGIRVALGARRSAVMALILRQSLVLTAVGIALGAGGAVALTRSLEQMLFGLEPLDMATYTAVSALFTAVAAIAAYVPARRATQVDPLIALRDE